MNENCFHNFEPRQIERFWSKVDKSPGLGPHGDCWEWTAGQKNKEGYGGFYIKQIDNTINCHKFVFLVVHNFGLNDLDDGIVIRHKCNNPRCVRPERLLMGSHKDNSQDMVRAGNSLKGERNRRAKLTEAQVKEIRQLWNEGEINATRLAERFDIGITGITGIIDNKTWHDPDYQKREFPETHNHRCKFTDKTIELIKSLRKSGWTYKRLSDEFCVSQTQVANIVRGLQRKQKGGGL